MGNVIIPTMYDIGVFDASKVYYIVFSANGSTEKFPFCEINITDSYDNTDTILTKIIDIDTNINDYIASTSHIVDNRRVVYYNEFYYLIIYPNYLRNGKQYSLEACFMESDGNGNFTYYPSNMDSFECHSDPIIALESYRYADGVDRFVNEGVTTLAVVEPVCLLNFSYTQNDGDALKYYYFELFNSNNKLLGRSKKIYSSSQITYGIENYNNLQSYKLVLHCLTQSGITKQVEYILNTNYNKESVYADIDFALDTENATNNISISVTQLNGDGENYSFDDSGEYVTIQDNGYVEFVDTYQTISKNFLCRMWCRNLNQDVPILKINRTDGNGYIEVFFTGQRFIAYKHSCDLTTSYASNYLIEDGVISENQNIYFAIGYYDGRIEMYTVILN